MNIKDKKILLLSPHTDDIEISMGGSIIKFLENGNKLYYVAFSIAKESVPDDFPEDEIFTGIFKSLFEGRI